MSPDTLMLDSNWKVSPSHRATSGSEQPPTGHWTNPAIVSDACTTLLFKYAFNWPAESKKRSSEEKVRRCTSPLWWNKVVRHVPFWTFQMQMRLLAPWLPPDADAMVWTRVTHRENEYRSHRFRIRLSGISRSVEVYRQKHQLIAIIFHSATYADNLRRL